MSTYNDMKFMKLIRKYEKTNQVKVEGDRLEILDPQMMEQLFTQKMVTYLHY